MTSVRHNPSSRAISEDALLDAARASILDLGWRRTTLTEVARRAGASRMTLYRKWPDMKSLVADLMTRELAHAIGPLAADHDAAIADAVVDAVRVIRGNELFARIIELDPELLLPYLLERRGRSQDLVLDALVPAIEAGQRDGTVRDADAPTMARALVLTAHGFTLSARTMLGAGGPRRAAAFDAELTTIIETYLAP